MLKIKLDSSITSIFSIDSDIVVGSEKGYLYLLDKNLKCKRKFKAKDRINDIYVDDIDKDGKYEILAGSDDRYLYVLDDKGKLKWKYRCANGEFGTIGRVKKVLFADLEGKGEKSILVGTGSWLVYRFTPEGKVKWIFKSYAYEPTVLATFDIDNDAIKEIIQGNNYFYLRCIDYKGKQKWQYYTGRNGPIIRCMDILENKIAIGVSDDCLHLIDDKGKLLWKENVGGEVTAVLGMDINNDGKKEILAGSESYNIWAFSQEGKFLWRKDLGDIIVAIKPYQGKILVATEEGLYILDKNGSLQCSYLISEKITKISLAEEDEIIIGTKAGDLEILKGE